MKLNLQKVTLRTAGLASQFSRDALPQIAFSGRSNVGKSSLINCLLGRKKLARVSGEPGKTITVNFYHVDNQLILVDLPGYGYAKRSPQEKLQWSRLVDGYFTDAANENLRCGVLQLVDLKVGITKDDATMLDFLNQTATPYVIVATKSDKLNATGRAAALAALRAHPLVAEDVPILPFSALKGEGKDAVWRAIFALTESAQ